MPPVCGTHPIHVPEKCATEIDHTSRLCSVHNEVNERLGKPNFDCAKLDETYDCGCGDAPVSSASATTPTTLATVDPGNTSPREDNFDPMDLERDTTKDGVTGVEMIKGGRR